MGFYLLLSASAFFPANAGGNNTFVIRNARIFDGHKILDHADVRVVEGKSNAKFGTAWMLSTDSIAGGKSTGEMKVIDGGANRGKHALGISGLIDGGLQHAWAGVMFSPGSQPFGVMNLWSKKSISFFAKARGRLIAF
jgi:hypothetical protein